MKRNDREPSLLTLAYTIVLLVLATGTFIYGAIRHDTFWVVVSCFYLLVVQLRQTEQAA